MSALDMEKEGGKVWRLTKAMNEEETKGARVTLENEDGEMCTEIKAGDLFSNSYAKESNVNIRREQEKKTELEEKQRLKGKKPP